MKTLGRLVPVALLAIAVPLAAPSRAESPAPATAPSDAEVRELAGRLDALKTQVDRLEAAGNDAAGRDLAQQSWRALQDYMGLMHSRWEAGAPWMMDPGSRGGPGASACPMLGGTGAAWPLPEGLSPRAYGERMGAHMRTLSEQMGQIAKATDPKERQRLLQEHWQTLYRDMQGIRGMGWMWRGMAPRTTGPGATGGAPAQETTAAQPLPDPDSAGAKLVTRYCVQCHTEPSPALLTAAQWDRVVSRMHVRIDGRVTPIDTPSGEEMKTILAYMKQHAH